MATGRRGIDASQYQLVALEYLVVQIHAYVFQRPWNDLNSGGVPALQHLKYLSPLAMRNRTKRAVLPEPPETRGLPDAVGAQKQ